MRDLYVDKQKLRLFYNPKESNKMEIFYHPERMLSDKMKFHKYPEGYRNDYGSPISSVVCKILLTNREHDGIWLIAEDNKNKVSIPGGHVGEDVLSYISSSQPYTAIYKTIIRELIEENPVLSDTQLIEPMSIRSTLEFVLDQYEFNILPSEFPLFYTYDNYKGSFIIFMIEEVDKPSENTLPFENHCFRNMIWYSRKEHSINSKNNNDSKRYRMKTIFNSPYADDIRTTKGGVLLLDKIFHTESIFGKLNIY